MLVGGRGNHTAKRSCCWEVALEGGHTAGKPHCRVWNPLGWREQEGTAGYSTGGVGWLWGLTPDGCTGGVSSTQRCLSSDLGRGLVTGSRPMHGPGHDGAVKGDWMLRMCPGSEMPNMFSPFPPTCPSLPRGAAGAVSQAGHLQLLGLAAE